MTSQLRGLVFDEDLWDETWKQLHAEKRTASYGHTPSACQLCMRDARRGVPAAREVLGEFINRLLKVQSERRAP